MSEKHKNINIRNYIPDDYPKLLNLWEQTGLSSPERSDDKKIIEQTLSMGGKLIIVEDTSIKEIIGSAWITFDGRRLLLHHFGISPKKQGKGLGKLLAKECLLFAKEKGYQIKLEVHSSNLQAIKLYEKAGFKPLAGYGIYIIRNIGNL